MANAWITHLQNTFKSGRSKNKSYSFGQAMKDAKKTYKNKGGGEKTKPMKSRRRKTARKSRK